MTRPLAGFSAKERQRTAELFGLLEERLSGTEDIRANGAVAYVLRRHIERSRDLFRAGLKRALLGMMSWSTLRLAISIGGILSLAIGAVLSLEGVITVGQVYLIFAYTDMLGHPVEQLMRQLDDLQQATASIGRVQELFDTQSVVTHLADDTAQPLPAGALSVDIERGELRLSGR